MEKFNELLLLLQGLNIVQDSGDWAECLPEDIWNKYFKDNFKVVSEGLDVDTHRWYETSTSVVEVCGGLLGVTFISNIFSESMGYEDCYEKIVFNKMKKVEVISYELV